jgi:hypothetical protein
MPGTSSPAPGMFVSRPIFLMKPIILVSSGLTIAILFGTAGYFLGHHQSVGKPLAERASQNQKLSPDSRKSAQPQTDFKNLQATLDAEKNPLARFKLATANLEAWVAKNPEEALNWLASQPPSERRDEIMRLALNQYAETNPRGAADWALAKLTGVELNNAIIGIAENWAQQNGGEAASWFLKLPVTAERTAALENTLFTWASNEPAAALEFLKSHEDLGELSPTLRRAALAGWAKTDPEGAVTASLDLSRTMKDTAQFANTLANWATMDLDASSGWLLVHLPPSAERTAAAAELATIFANQSPAAGVQWLEKLNAGEERDRAANELAASWSRSGPAEAAKWAANQTSSKLSAETVTQISQNFLMKNAAAFEAWRGALPPGPLKDAAAQVGATPEEE